MVNIRYVPLPDNSVRYKKTSYPMTPTRVVIHNTANIAPAYNEISYMGQSDDYRSFHYAVDDTEAVQGLPLDVNGWHAGDGAYGTGNREGIGIEICLSYSLNGEEDWIKNYKARFERAQENAAELTAYLLHKFGWGYDPTRITKHQDYQNKYCPHRTLSDYGWDFFLKLVKTKYQEMYEKKEEDTAMTAAEKKEFDALVKRVDALEGQAMPKWSKTREMPDWMKPTIEKLVSKGLLKGNENGSLEMSYALGRMFVVLDRAGVFDE